MMCAGPTITSRLFVPLIIPDPSISCLYPAVKKIYGYNFTIEGSIRYYNVVNISHGALERAFVDNHI